MTNKYILEQRRWGLSPISFKFTLDDKIGGENIK